MWVKKGMKKVSLRSVAQVVIPENAPINIQYYDYNSDNGRPINHLIFKSTLSANAKLVMSVLCINSFHGTCVVINTQSNLAQQCSMSQKTLRAALGELLDSNMIKCEFGVFNGKQKKYIYINKSSEWNINIPPDDDEDFD